MGPSDTTYSSIESILPSNSISVITHPQILKSTQPTPLKRELHSSPSYAQGSADRTISLYKAMRPTRIQRRVHNIRLCLIATTIEKSHSYLYIIIYHSNRTIYVVMLHLAPNGLIRNNCNSEFQHLHLILFRTLMVV